MFVCLNLLLRKNARSCVRPFTNFRWKAGPKGRYKNTEVCQTCAKIKNVCQTCLLDLQYHLPVQVRDEILGDKKVVVPTQEANRNFWSEQANKSLESLALPYDDHPNSQVLEQLAKNRAKPYSQRNLPHICSFFAKGECRRGDECPYRHELPPEPSPLSEQNIKDRFLGQNDPVANKILGRVYDNPRVKPPEDKSISSMYIRDLPTELTESYLVDIFQAYGEVDSVKILPGGKSAIVEFADRSTCEKVIKELYGKLVIKNQAVQVMWSRPQSAQKVEETKKDPSLLIPQNIPSMIKPPIMNHPNARPPTLPPPNGDMSALNQDKFIDSIGQIGNSTFYPSMNPNSMGGVRSDNSNFRNGK